MRLLPVLIPLVAAFIGMMGAILSALGFARPGRMPGRGEWSTTGSITTTPWATRTPI